MTLSSNNSIAGRRRSAPSLESPTPSGIGHDDAMPASVHPLRPLPGSIQDALEAVKAPSRVLIAHHLASHPRSRMGEIVDKIGGERHMIQAHLAAMEMVGIVVVSLPGDSESATRWREYSLDQARWTDLVIRLINYLPSDPNLDER